MNRALFRFGRRSTADLRRGPLVCEGVHPNAGVTARYTRALVNIVAAMNSDYATAILAAYGLRAPHMAQDELPAAELSRIIAELGKRWASKFNDFAQAQAARFTKEARASADTSFEGSLRDAGFVVDFKLTREVQDVLKATMKAQVSLIKSIGSEFHTAIEGTVMRAYQSGRDMGALASELLQRHDITARRARLIARDQTSKATAAITSSRQDELGITEAIWVHSANERAPRPSHVAANGKLYNIKKGMYLDGVWTWPGVEINCQCVSRSVIPGMLAENVGPKATRLTLEAVSASVLGEAP